MFRFVTFYWHLRTENAVLSKNILSKKETCQAKKICHAFLNIFYLNYFFIKCNFLSVKTQIY